MLFVALCALELVTSALPLYIALWLFFVAFNYLEATLPSQVSKTVFAGGKGTALGVYATSQFFGIFCGGAGGGWVLQHFGQTYLLLLCLMLTGIWFLWMLGAGTSLQPEAESASGAR